MAADDTAQLGGLPQLFHLGRLLKAEADDKEGGAGVVLLEQVKDRGRAAAGAVVKSQGYDRLFRIEDTGSGRIGRISA